MAAFMIGLERQRQERVFAEPLPGLLGLKLLANVARLPAWLGRVHELRATDDQPGLATQRR